MNIEIERKWLVSEEFGKTLIRNRTDQAIITQAYLAKTCRVRQTVMPAEESVITDITIKLATSTLSREEYTYRISPKDAGSMLERLDSIRKHRFELNNGFTLDVFKGKLSGLYLLEKEYSSEEDALSDQLPEDWEAVDVTETQTFSNSNLTGKRWDPKIGLVRDAGLTELQFGGEPFPPNVEFRLVTGDREDLMPPPLIIP